MTHRIKKRYNPLERYKNTSDIVEKCLLFMIICQGNIIMSNKENICLCCLITVTWQRHHN